jgi:hypothetical protein
MLPPVPFDWGAFAIYVLFLGLFCHVTIGNQGQSTYRLAQFSRDIVGTNEGDRFMEIGTYAEYVEWLEFQFFYGLGNVSYRMDLNTNGTVALVGPPRVRQIRSGSECPIEHFAANFAAGLFGEDQPVHCYNSDEDSGGWSMTEDGYFGSSYFEADEISERAYSSNNRNSYSGSGYLLNNVSQLLRRVPTRHSEGTEFYRFAHSRLNIDDMLATGWLHPQTRAIFHDFTLFSPAASAYVNVRLVVEIGVADQVYVPNKHFRVLAMKTLADFPDIDVVIEMLFMILLGYQVLEDIYSYGAKMMNVELYIRENIVRGRFELRLKMLEQAAFKGLFPYRPRVLMRQLSRRINSAPADRRHHVERLNRIGRAIPKLHEQYQQFMRTNRAHGSVDPEEMAVAVVAILKQVSGLGTLQWEHDLLVGRVPKIGCGAAVWCRLHTIRIRVIRGWKVYTSNGWEILDWINYIMFIGFVGIRLGILESMQVEKLGLIRKLGELDDPYQDDSHFVEMYTVSFWTSMATYCNALNALFTWVKLFKFLNYFPNMRILTQTLLMAASPLMWFGLILLIVLVGSGQILVIDVTTVAQCLLPCLAYTSMRSAHIHLCGVV